VIRSVRIVVCLAASAVLALAACAKRVEAPLDAGVCWHVVALKDGTYRFNRLTDRLPNIESCAGALEGMRLRFLGLGGGMHDIAGAYQGNFIFLQPEGVFISQSLTGNRYLALVRTQDGQLVPQGAVGR
jgi:hypothetical protein